MCENCKNLFDLKKNLPYLIPCGHTLCEECLNLLEFSKNKCKCPIDSKEFEIEKEKIPKNEMLIDYMKENILGPRYSYQVRESVITDATFCHIISRNYFQKIGHYFYKLIYVKIVLSLANLMLWPFKKIYQFIRKIKNLIYLNYLKIKLFFIKIYKKLKSIRFPKLNINCKYYYKIKERIVHSRIKRAIIKFFKYTLRAPIFLNYLKLMKNLLYKSQTHVNNKCLKVVNVILTLMGIFLSHLIASLTNNLENFFIILLLLNESTIVLNNFRKMNEEKELKRYIYKNKLKNKKARGVKKKSDFGMGNYINNKNSDEEDDEYLKDKKNHHRGKKCVSRWIGFILFWYFFPMISEYLIEFIKYWEYSKNYLDYETQEKNIKNNIGVVNSLLVIPKLLIVFYITS